jgi:hypothetical protein
MQMKVKLKNKVLWQEISIVKNINKDNKYPLKNQGQDLRGFSRATPDVHFNHRIPLRKSRRSEFHPIL